MSARTECCDERKWWVRNDPCHDCPKLPSAPPADTSGRNGHHAFCSKGCGPRSECHICAAIDKQAAPAAPPADDLVTRLAEWRARYGLNSDADDLFDRLVAEITQLRAQVNDEEGAKLWRDVNEENRQLATRLIQAEAQIERLERDIARIGYTCTGNRCNDPERIMKEVCDAKMEDEREIERLEAALDELIACKNIKELAEAISPVEPGSRKEVLMDEYRRRQPLAWAAARAARAASRAASF